MPHARTRRIELGHKGVTEDEILAWAKANKQEIVKKVVANKSSQEHPIAIIMAGIPGAGKTEFLNRVIENMPSIIKIDLDNLVSNIPGYTPEIYYKYRKAANVLVSGLLDYVYKNNLDFALDGTFCHDSGCSNIRHALKHGFEVTLFVIDQSPEKAWELAEARRKLTGRPISRDGFVQSCHNLVPKVREALSEFRDSPQFYINVITKTDNMGEPYRYISDLSVIDEKLNQMYINNNIGE